MLKKSQQPRIASADRRHIVSGRGKKAIPIAEGTIIRVDVVDNPISEADVCVAQSPSKLLLLSSSTTPQSAFSIPSPLSPALFHPLHIRISYLKRP